MARFAPGDRVLVRSDLHELPRWKDMHMDDNDARVSLDSDHIGYEGAVIVIDEIYTFGDGRYWCYCTRNPVGGEVFWADEFFVSDVDEDSDREVDEISLLEVLSI